VASEEWIRADSSTSQKIKGMLESVRSAMKGKGGPDREEWVEWAFSLVRLIKEGLLRAL